MAFLRTHDVCEQLGISTRTLRRYVKSGALRPVQAGERTALLFTAEELAKLAEQRRAGERPAIQAK